ncbi:MAG: alpha/beta fold hydrolase [Snowella sp.]|nr:alpha/beta fold hydrolase [Snowella sp.]
MPFAWLSKLLISGVSLGAVAYLGICISLWVGQNRLIFVPSAQMEGTPADVGLTYQEIWLPVGDNPSSTEKIHAWWIPRSHKTPKNEKVLLYLHGNGGNISSNIGRAKRYQKLGFSVLLIDYRGYGRSVGAFPTEARVYQDAQIAWNYLVQERKIAPENIFIYGHSLGGAIAIDLAVRQPQAAGVIVESTFTSLKQMAELEPRYRWLPIDFVLHQRFDSLKKVPRLKMPLLFIHGKQDSTVPAAMSQTLFETATAPKQLLLIPEAEHNNVSSVGDERYNAAVEQFIQLVEQSSHSSHFLRPANSPSSK